MTFPDGYGAGQNPLGQNPVTDIRPRVQRIEPQMGDHARQLQAAQPPARPVERATEPPVPELTYLESIAKRVLYLPYGDMKELAADAMGNTEVKTPADFADRLHDWAKRIEAAALAKAGLAS